MKNVVFIALAMVVFATSATQAQIRKVPASVTEAFRQKYPMAVNVEWKDKLSSFTAEFELDGKKQEARFNTKGDWVNTEEEITDENLPDEVKEGFEKSKYSDWETEKVFRVELPGQKIEYRVEVAKSDLQKKNLVFNSNGRLLRDRITL